MIGSSTVPARLKGIGGTDARTSSGQSEIADAVDDLSWRILSNSGEERLK